MLQFKQSVAHTFFSIWNEMLQVLWDTHKKSWIYQINVTNLSELKIKREGKSNNNCKQELFVADVFLGTIITWAISIFVETLVSRNMYVILTYSHSDTVAMYEFI